MSSTLNALPPSGSALHITQELRKKNFELEEQASTNNYLALQFTCRSPFVALTLILLNCLCVHYIHLQLELLTQFPAFKF